MPKLRRPSRRKGAACSNYRRSLKKWRPGAGSAPQSLLAADVEALRWRASGPLASSKVLSCGEMCTARPGAVTGKHTLIQAKCSAVGGILVACTGRCRALWTTAGTSLGGQPTSLSLGRCRPNSLRQPFPMSTHLGQPSGQKVGIGVPLRTQDLSGTSQCCESSAHTMTACAHLADAQQHWLLSHPTRRTCKQLHKLPPGRVLGGSLFLERIT